MHFLNVYPKRLHTLMNANGVFEGQMYFNLEQYGLLFEETACDVEVRRRPEASDRWQLVVHPLDGIEVPHFAKFAAALDHYLFEEQRISPNLQGAGQALPSWDVFFDDIYFDMSGDEPSLCQKAVPRPAPAKSADA